MALYIDLVSLITRLQVGDGPMTYAWQSHDSSKSLSQNVVGLSNNMANRPTSDWLLNIRMNFDLLSVWPFGVVLSGMFSKQWSNHTCKTVRLKILEIQFFWNLKSHNSKVLQLSPRIYPLNLNLHLHLHLQLGFCHVELSSASSSRWTTGEQ